MLSFRQREMLIVLKVWHTCCKSCLAETMYASPLHSVSSETSARQHWTIFQPTKNLFPIRHSKKMCIFRVFVTVHNMGPAPYSWRIGSQGLCKVSWWFFRSNRALLFDWTLLFFIPECISLACRGFPRTPRGAQER